MNRKITIDPITRLEGHGKIEIFLNEEGNVKDAYLQIPELRGFEEFSKGRPAEDMARITPRICGVCPSAHMMASAKALDNLYKIDPTSAAKKLRELFYSTFFVEDHAIHFFYLGGPDFVVGPTAPKGERNILGVLNKVGLDVGKKVILMRKQLREILGYFGGKPIHPAWVLPGGVSKGLTEEKRAEFEKVALEAVEFGKFCLQIFDDVVLKNKQYIDLITSESYILRTKHMSMVDSNKKSNFYDGAIRIVDEDGKLLKEFDVIDYENYFSEIVEPWTYGKFLHMKDCAWNGLNEDRNSGIVSSTPLSRINASDGMSTPLAQAEADKMYSILGRPSHHTLAVHWARLIELVSAAERMVELIRDPEITSDNVRTIPTEIPTKGVGAVQAPRGLLVHHYETDSRGLITKANLLVATQFNLAPICMSVKKAATGLIKNGEVNDGLLNMVEMAFRLYDPCFSCTTHSLLGETPLKVDIYDENKKIYKSLVK
ncbi:MAG: Ni/Fe hydrogenase subunit alpha [Candidatus Margulisiibacteriota bacterium]|nr:MAG: F420-nonreducing hydrogenase [Candidatus Margulisbacteria bacterium GWD2_39_127]OGI04410.1 MAG: F420-nonreducing hydrogenase [Candidatus Margulisbacteria bacterium GWF2_38_17]OGI07344.1 MAG: F420-nonreducing hydrogenase [Candidatus Margulisbacteria bacterium GWE2_39_32]PZM80076.1 MAG: Ni/Fe hydrogenase subunit alpha [Candidatus Margulisiibacteriota bacterium]HAR62853.1 Ni/Fe hydrogenase subunit alpha [Candidatus Margulisiibacteriota bacterium]